MKLLGSEKILVCDFRRIGDGIMSLPMFESLKKRYPNCKTTFVCENIAQGIADYNPYIDEVFYFNKNSKTDVIKLILTLRSKKFDVAIDSLGMPKTALMCWLSGAKIRVGIHHRRKMFYTELFQGDFEHIYSAHHKLSVLKLLDAFPKENLPLPFINILDEEKKQTQKILDEFFLEAKSFFTSSPGSKLDFTLWSVAKWAQIYDWIIEKYGVKIILLYAPSEKQFVLDIVKEIKNIDNIVVDLEFRSIRDIAKLLSLSKLHITQNNGTKHIANCVKTPCLTLWGFESSYENWKVPEDSPLIDRVIYGGNYKDEKREYSSSTEPISFEDFQKEIEKVIEEIEQKL